MDTTGQYLEVVVIGLFLGPTAAAFYFVATRITNVFAMITGQHQRLRDAADQCPVLPRCQGRAAGDPALARDHRRDPRGRRLRLVIAFGGSCCCGLRRGLSSAYPALLVLTAGASIGALAGPASYVLLLTGNEGAYPRIMGCRLLGRLRAHCGSRALFGLMGAAIAWSISTIVMASVLVIACRRLIGLDPSLLGVILRSRAAEPSLKGSMP